MWRRKKQVGWLKDRVGERMQRLMDRANMLDERYITLSEQAIPHDCLEQLAFISILLGTWRRHGVISEQELYDVCHTWMTEPRHICGLVLAARRLGYAQALDDLAKEQVII